jgi:Fe-S cluster assembly scaffold protein SufB
VPDGPPRSAKLVDERRAAALKVYEAEEVPTWRRSGFWTTSLRNLDLAALEPRRYDELDSEIVHDHLGDEEHAALIVQRGASVVHTDVSDERITVMPLEQAVEEHPELVEPHFARRLPYDEGKFPAGNAAFWTGGVFVHVPRDVRLEAPSRPSG